MLAVTVEKVAGAQAVFEAAGHVAAVVGPVPAIQVFEAPLPAAHVFEAEPLAAQVFDVPAPAPAFANEPPAIQVFDAAAAADDPPAATHVFAPPAVMDEAAQLEEPARAPFALVNAAQAVAVEFANSGPEAEDEREAGSLDMADADADADVEGV